jgi:hypothetical protein
VDRLDQQAGSLELAHPLSKSSRIDRARSPSHLVEAEWVVQQGLDDHQAPLFLEQHDGGDEARACTAGV